ncbi:MAG: hypothetical protein D6721_00210 [Gammaproteobacteria bacterium]|nr:MAG: hypothetical protein D6721_00210 [Gammaproteobacteria bacterium]
MPEVTDCDAARAVCETVGSGVHVRLRLGPGVRAMHPFPVVLEVPKAHGVVIRFEMPGMDMGKNVYRLDRAAPGRWAGKAILPICLSGRTDWVARVEIERADGRYLAVFPFHVGP